MVVDPLPACRVTPLALVHTDPAIVFSLSSPSRCYLGYCLWSASCLVARDAGNTQTSNFCNPIQDVRIVLHFRRLVVLY
jgi:hypothetical protein